MAQERQNQIEEAHQGLEMYFNPEIAKIFAEREQNEKNFRVAALVDNIILSEIESLSNPVYAAELGGGAHPDRYHDFFKRLLTEPRGHIDWVDISPYMLELAGQYIDNKNYRDRKRVIKFIQSDILEYLRRLQGGILDLAIMKYTIDHISDLEELFGLLARKLKSGGRVVATIGVLNPELKSIGTNARFLYNGEEFPENEARTLKDGDSFTVRFFKESGNPGAGYLEGAETVKYYHSPARMKELASKYGFNIFLGDWKDLLSEEKQEDEKLDQDILVLRKGAGAV